MTKQYELLPCPFCGGEALMVCKSLRSYDNSIDIDTSAFVVCQKCSTQTIGVVSNIVNEGGLCVAEKEAMRIWNRRASIPKDAAPSKGYKSNKFVSAYQIEIPQVINALDGHKAALASDWVVVEFDGTQHIFSDATFKRFFKEETK